MKKLLVSATIVLGLVLTLFVPALAKDPECKFNNGQNAWKIVNASGGLGDLQFETLEECQAYLDNPATEPPTDVPTLEPTDVPTDEPTLEPTEEPTEVVSTDEPTEIVPTEVATESGQKSRGRGNLCYRAYLILRFNQDKEPGYQIVREYPWCLVWMKLKYDFVPYIPPVE